MRYLSFADPELSRYPVALLVPSIRKDDIRKHYIDPYPINENDVLVVETFKAVGKKKPSAGEIKEWFEQELAPTLADLKTEYLLVADANYFKVLAKTAKVEAHLGYVMDCALGDFKIIYVPNYQAVIYDPENVTTKIKAGMEALIKYRTGLYTAPGSMVIKFAAYPQTDMGIEQWLRKLLEDGKPLTADIEGFGLKHYESGVGTISFAWNQGEGIAFPIDYQPVNQDSQYEKDENGFYGNPVAHHHRRKLLRDFFITAREMGITIKWHNIGFDVYILIYQLFMEHLLDQEGLLYGMEILLGDVGEWDCTKLITYLATNTCAGNSLKLKDQAQEFAGNYAQDEIKDIRKIPLPELLKYNLVDSLSTWYVFDKHWPTLIQDNQLPVYRELFQPAMVDIIQMQLTGMPVNMKQVLKVETLLNAIESAALDTLNNSKVINHYNTVLRHKHVAKRNDALKKKQITFNDDETQAVEFNPNSNPQLQELLFEILELPVLALTDGKQPAADGDTLKNLKNHTKDPDTLEFLQGLIDYKAVNKIITDFIPSLKNSQLGPDGWHYLFGNFNLGGTKSGRLSCVAPWTKIETDRGSVPITNIRIGDLVWTHKRRWKPVTALIRKPIEEMVDIQFCTGHVLSCTTAHRLNVPGRGWMSVQEIIDERIEEVDAEPSQYNQGFGSVSNYRNDDGTNNRQIANHPTQCQPSNSYSPTQRRTESPTGSQVFHIQDRGQEPNEGKNERSSSQLHWGMRGWLWVSDHLKGWKETIRSSSNDGRRSWSQRASRVLGRSSHRREQTAQRIGQLCSGNTSGTSENSLTDDHVQYGKIKEINYRSATQVWDISVADDESYWAEGCFNHNSSGPNLQNLPANVVMAISLAIMAIHGELLAPYVKKGMLSLGKLIKSCFEAPPGWIFAGLDFDSLEDRISALTTKDPNKLKVYTDGFDGHCLRAYTYWPEKMPDIDPSSVNSINSIAKLYPEDRNDSKAPTFALTYQGTWLTLVRNCGFSDEVAKSIEDRFKDLYKVSIDWVSDKLNQATKDGYITIAFGLRLRTPLLGQVIRGTKATPAAAEAEGRTAGNALGQSWCLLNSRAGSEFMGKVRKSEHRLSIKPCAQIHDAGYFLMKDCIEVILYANTHLVTAVQWQAHPDIYHPDVKLGGSLGLFYPNWTTEITIPNGATEEDIMQVIQKHFEAS